MTPTSRRILKNKPGNRSIQKRVKALSHIQKPGYMQKKISDFFPPSPKFIENKVISKHICVDLENQAPPSNCKTKREVDIPEQKYGLRPKKSQPRMFYGFEPETEKIATIQAKNIQIKKEILKENSTNVILQTKNDTPPNIDKITCLMKSKTNASISNSENAPPKSPLCKPQRNARRIYLKYGTRIPSFNDILKSREELIKFKEGVACVAELQKDPILQDDDKSGFNLEAPDSEEILERLDCKHIPLDELKDLFKGYKDFVIGIGNGAIPSVRHRIYMQDPFGGSEFNWGDLTFNISMSSFTTKQKVLLAKLTKKALGANKLTYNNQYYFKVVLPELCFKMFMHEHKLSEDEATKYLTNPRQA